MNIKIYFLALIVFTTNLQIKSQINPYHYRSQKKIIAEKGAVVSAHPLASKTGLLILKKGGNAIDAAITVQLVLAVVYPGAGNLGGGGFLVGALSNGKHISIDYREMAPSAATRDMYLDSNGNEQLNKSQDGHLASGVPGTVAGLFASMKYARLPFKILIQPAIDLAEKGFVLTEIQANDFNSHQESFKKLNTITPAFIKLGGWKAGDTLIQKDLANTLKRIRDYGQKGFYEGATADLILAEMKRGNGIITKEDLKNYQAKERAVMLFPYKKFQILTMPLPSSGGILLKQMLGMISNRRIDTMLFQSPQSVQLMTEVERRAFADRGEYMGDADFVKVPVKKMTSESYLTDRMKDFEKGKANKSENVKPGLIAESEETTHLSVCDQYGNAVAVTTTLNGHFGSSTVVGGAGFLLNNEMDDFSVKPRVPNMYGAIGNEKNAIAPGKRMLSSMTPTLVLKNNKPYIIVGTPGGTTIPTSVFQSIVNMLEFNMNAEDAVNKPKFHHQWLPDAIFVEKEFNQNTAGALSNMGYTIKERGNIGRTELIQILNGKITAIADKRGEDDAEGY
jgi:gamma-glutamyltranspeptidase/glutathione hydrolase